MENQKKKTILLVEDESLLAMTTTKILKSFGYHVTGAISGEEAVDKASNDKSIDLILMDIDLGPGIDGSEAASIILKKRHLPIVFLTSHSEEEYVNKVKKITRYGYVLKGSNDFVLRESIQMAFELFDKYEESLRSEQALKSISQGVLIAGLDRKIIQANDAFLTITGYVREEVIGKTCQFLQGPKSDPITISRIRKCLNENQEFSGEILNYKRNGEIFWNDLTISPVLNDQGELINFIGVTRDVTDRKKIIESFQMHAENFLFNNVFQFVPFPLSLTTIEFGNFLALNKAAEEIFGYKQSEILGKSANELMIWYHPADRDKIIDTIKTQSYIKDFETQIKDRSGNLRWISFSGQFLEVNGISCLLSGSIDITSRKAQEREREIETKILEHVAKGGNLDMLLSEIVLCYEELFPDAIGSVLLLDPTGKYLVLGSAPNLPDEFNRNINGSPIGPSSGSCGTAAYTKKVTIVADIANDPLWLDYKQFALPHNLLSCWSVPIIGSNGLVLGTFAFYSHTIRIATELEISALERGAHLARIAIERNIASEILFENKNRFKTLFEQAAVGVAELETLTGKFIRINKKYCEILGYSESEMLHLDFMKITHKDTLQADLDGMSKLISNEIREYSVEKQYIRKDQKLCWVHLTVSAMWEPGSKPDYHIAIVQDITERKINEQKINDLLSEKEILIKEIHHRIKNNMSVVHSLLDLHASNLKEPSAINALMDASSRVQCMSMLYDKLYKSPDFKTMFTEDYISELVDEIIGNFTNGKSVKIRKRIQNFELSAEKFQPLGIILNELLTNTLKYAFPGGGEGLITISLTLENGTVSLEVSDNGVGLPNSVDFSISTGFGLNLVKMLSIQLYGNLNLERKKGTSIRVTFPYER
ncbi:response regulator [Leptospira ognonensis]|uniref:histidine kinase n=1 Tax=Leptospira ognonensis TaxID=2484945 RepID=A0A4R9JV68_9LEPT|nr:PAS domain S-box protein [Leptospira ognonensis]TGL56226.1 response regulator [Leptospira ognonensis]